MEIYHDEKAMPPASGKATDVFHELKTLNGHHHSPQPSTPTITNRLSSRQMESLTAVADTLLPSISLPLDVDKATQVFYGTSASMMGTPDTLGRYMSGKLQHPMVGLLKLGLWLLSTWYGTVAICGARSLSRQFPYFRRFKAVEPRRREEILLSLSHSNFFLYRLLFKGLKFLVVLFYFTQVDEKNQNPTWKAIDYCGPDPELTQQKQKIRDTTTKNPTTDQNTPYSDPTTGSGPLHDAVVHLHHPKDAISAALRGRGISLSGGVVAGVLAKAGHKVVVLEKGGYTARTNLTLLEGEAMDSMYEGSGLLSTSDLGVIVLAGSTVGGGSTVNWSASIRTPDNVINEWCNDYELELFGSDAYREALDVVCERMGVQATVDDSEGLSNEVLRRGCEELGYPVCNIPRNCTTDHDCGWCCFGCKDGRKKGTTETWLADMAESGNGVVLPGCRAVRVLQEKEKGRRRTVAKGVVFEYEGGSYTVESKVTVVACGALGTPVLLRKSGLRNRNIGRNLHLHPVVMVWGTFPNPPPPGKKKKKTKKSYEGGIMTAMSTVASNTATTGYGALLQTPSLHPGMFSVVTPWLSSSDFRHRMTRFSHTAHIFALARDKGSGTVNPDGSLSYTISPHDEDSLKNGVEKILHVMAAAGATEVGTQHCMGDRLAVKKASSHEFQRFVKEVGGRGLRDLSTPVCSAHQMGSCRMGVEEGTSVVDMRGETWEVERLFVADSSVFPTALGVNPMVTVMATAYCTAQSVLEVLRRSKKYC